jgi:filamentous hemagglutinin
MLDEATLMPKFKFGDPDAQDPNLIRRGEEVFRVGEHFDIDRWGRVYRPHQYVALAGEHGFSEAKTAEKLALPVCETGPKHRYFEHCQFFAKSLEKLAEAVQALDEGHGAVAAQVRELQYEEECVSQEERQDPREMFLGLLKGLRGRARTTVRPPPPSPIRKAPGDLATPPPPPYLSQPAPGLTSHAGADGVQVAAAGGGGGGSAAWRSSRPAQTRRGDGATRAQNHHTESVDLGKAIAQGHAFEKHVIQQGEFQHFGIRTPEDFAKHIDKVVSLARGSNVRALAGGRKAYWDEVTGTVVIHNPSVPDMGTAFRPKTGRKYFEGLN